jgi:hypothetical protein
LRPDAPVLFGPQVAPVDVNAAQQPPADPCGESDGITGTQAYLWSSCTSFSAEFLKRSTADAIVSYLTGWLEFKF